METSIKCEKQSGPVTITALASWDILNSPLFPFSCPVKDQKHQIKKVYLDNKVW